MGVVRQCWNGDSRSQIGKILSPVRAQWKRPSACGDRKRKASLAWLKAVCHKYLTAVFLGTLKRSSKEHFDTEAAKLPTEADTNCNLLMKWKCFTRREVTRKWFIENKLCNVIEYFQTENDLMISHFDILIVIRTTRTTNVCIISTKTYLPYIHSTTTNMFYFLQIAVSWHPLA